MKTRIFSAVVIAILGLLLIVVPRYIFPVCEYAGTNSAANEAVHPGLGHSGHGSTEIQEEVSHGAQNHNNGEDMPMVIGSKKSTHPPMVCLWTQRAEIGLGLLVIFAGVLWLLFNSPRRRQTVAVMTGALALYSAALPTWLIGVCSGMVPCRTATLPALLILSGFVFLWAVVNVILLVKPVRKSEG